MISNFERVPSAEKGMIDKKINGKYFSIEKRSEALDAQKLFKVDHSLENSSMIESLGGRGHY